MGSSVRGMPSKHPKFPSTLHTPQILWSTSQRTLKTKSELKTALLLYPMPKTGIKRAKIWQWPPSKLPAKHGDTLTHSVWQLSGPCCCAHTPSAQQRGRRRQLWQSPCGTRPCGPGNHCSRHQLGPPALSRCPCRNLGAARMRRRGKRHQKQRRAPKNSLSDMYPS